MADVIKEEKLSQEERLFRIRHATAHIMAEAVIRMFPDAKIAIGPPIEHGFYYDFDLPRSLTPEDLETIEEQMRSIVSEDHQFVKEVVDRGRASELFKEQPYKLEILNDLPEDEEISLYSVDEFTDLCEVSPFLLPLANAALHLLDLVMQPVHTGRLGQAWLETAGRARARQISTPNAVRTDARLFIIVDPRLSIDRPKGSHIVPQWFGSL